MHSAILHLFIQCPLNRWILDVGFRKTYSLHFKRSYIHTPYLKRSIVLSMCCHVQPCHSHQRDRSTRRNLFESSTINPMFLSLSQAIIFTFHAWPAVLKDNYFPACGEIIAFFSRGVWSVHVLTFFAMRFIIDKVGFNSTYK